MVKCERLRTALIALAIYGFINILFIYKYASRFLTQSWIWILIYSFMMILLILVLYEDLEFNMPYRLQHIIFMSSVIAIAVLLIAAMLRFDPQHIRVGRFPALYDWIARLLSGDFPYISPTRPSGFPFLFAVALPFLLLGDLGFLQIFAFLLYALIIHLRHKENGMNRLRSLIMLTTAPIFLYEIVVRSDLFSNMVFIILYLLICEVSVSHVRTIPLFLLGLLGGLLLSTRGIVLPIYVLYFGYVFKDRLARGFTFASGVLMGFVATLLPFVLWNYGYFIDHGPFSIQMSYLPLWMALLSIIVCTYLALRVNSLQGIYRCITYMLFSIIFVAFVLSVKSNGWHSTIHGDGFDISYFCFTLPFLLLTLNYRGDEKTSSEPMFCKSHQ